MSMVMTRNNFEIHPTTLGSLKGYLLKVKEELEKMEGETIEKDWVVGVIADLAENFPLISEKEEDMIILKIKR